MNIQNSKVFWIFFLAADKDVIGYYLKASEYWYFVLDVYLEVVHQITYYQQKKAYKYDKPKIDSCSHYIFR